MKVADETDKKKRFFSSRLERVQESRREIKEVEETGPQGFTAYSELINGRLAQLGFVIGLVTEIVSGKPMGEQIVTLFSPVVQLANELTVLSASAGHISHITLP